MRAFAYDRPSSEVAAIRAASMLAQLPEIQGRAPVEYLAGLSEDGSQLASRHGKIITLYDEIGLGRHRDQGQMRCASWLFFQRNHRTAPISPLSSSVRNLHSPLCSSA